ncbi:helix-turn-helix domain-containing protein [Maricaulis sp.]|uniref:helix-turn-helix domain-containing protein n=1 Tax=Maricaulis sp. TaxID=1486257 RepID=UPI00262F25FF|nr:helix-turn-helix domain-containing protein [Maricaulis sp.]
MKFGEYLRRRREANGWTQPEAAQRAGIEQSYLSKLETGRSYPSEEVFARLAAAFEIDPSEMAEQVTDTEIDRLREVGQVREAVAGRERRRMNVSRAWMVGGLVSLILAAASGGIAVTAQDMEQQEYHYLSYGVLNLDESLDAFEIVDSRVDAQDGAESQRQSEMVARLAEDYRVVGRFRGRSYNVDVEGGRRHYQLVDDRLVVTRTPLRWFAVPGLMLLAGAIGAFFISFRWKN